MPHVTVKMKAGRSEAQKQGLAEAIVQAVVAHASCPAKVVSVAIEDVAPEDWVEQVYRPDILARTDTLYRRPGYDPP